MRRDLKELAGEDLGRFRLTVFDWRPGRHTESYHFTLGLEGEGAPSGSIFSGLYHAPVPTRRIAGWIDGNYNGTAESESGERASLPELGVEDLLFDLLGSVLPPSGWLALAYETLGVDTPLLQVTRRWLALGAPPVVTPIGRLLHRAGCGLHIRDWYIAEGWREGPRKLQGFKPAHKESARRRRAETLEALEEFLARARGEPELAEARRAAKALADAIAS